VSRCALNALVARNAAGEALLPATLPAHRALSRRREPPPAPDALLEGAFTWPVGARAGRERAGKIGEAAVSIA